MTPAHDGGSTPGSPGGRTAAGASRARDADRTPPAASAGAGVPSTLHDLEDTVHRLEAESEHRPPPAGPVANVIAAVIVVALGGAALVGSLQLGAGTAGNPGPGTWPTIISVVLVVLGVALAVVARRTSDAERFTPAAWLVLAGLVSMVVFVVLLPVIGFEIPAAVLAFFWLRFLGGETWRSSIVTTVGIVVAFYLIFVAALSVPIPHLF